jgi:hypothetical protein
MLRASSIFAAVVALVAGLGALGACSTSSANGSGDPTTPAPAPVPTNANPGESTPSKEKEKDPTTQIVVGVDAEDFRSGGYNYTGLQIIAKVDGLLAAQKTLDTEAGPVFPQEVRLVAPKEKPDALVEVTVALIMNSATVVTRRATTKFVPGATKLAYVRLEVRCNTFPLLGGGDPGGPTCDKAGETCIGALCRSDVLPPLPDYRTDWATKPPSMCGSGDPVVSIGKGEKDYTQLVANETLTAECGPQGGTHLWLGLRMSNLEQLGTITTISATQPGTSVTVPATAYPYSYSAVAAGGCELLGLRFRLDAGATQIADLLGKPLDISVNAKDKSGHDLTTIAHVNLAATRNGMFCP